MNKLTETVTVHVTAETKLQLDCLAKYDGMDVSIKIRELIERYLDKKKSELVLLEQVFGKQAQ